MRTGRNTAAFIIGSLVCIAVLSVTGSPGFEADSQPAGDSVGIRNAVLKHGGYVVIFGERVRDGSTILLGTSDYLPAGTYATLHVDLFDTRIREFPVPGDRYIITLHADNGDKFYDPVHDTPVTTITGASVSRTVTVL